VEFQPPLDNAPDEKGSSSAETSTAADTGPLEPVGGKVKVRAADRATMILLFISSLIAAAGIGFAVGHFTAGTSTGAAGAVGAGGGAAASGRGGALPGRSLAPGETFAFGANGSFAPGQGGEQRVVGVGGASTVSGTVQSISSASMTVLLANGTSVTIDLTGTTTFHTENSATSSAVSVGSSVLVQLSTTAQAGASPQPGASAARALTASDVIIKTP
jgi:hypothetical protein